MTWQRLRSWASRRVNSRFCLLLFWFVVLKSRINDEMMHTHPSTPSSSHIPHTGPVYGQLKAGRPATLPDGRTVQPAEVVGASSPGAVFGFVQCPDGENDPASILPPPSAWLGALGLPSSSSETAAGRSTQRHVNCLVHYTAAATAHTAGYQAWMASFGPQTTHILAALPVGAHRSPFRAARLNNLRLHGLDPAIFPRAPGFTPLPLPAVAEEAGCRVVWGENLMKYRLAPLAKEGLDIAGVLGDVTPEDEAELRREVRHGYGEVCVAWLIVWIVVFRWRGALTLVCLCVPLNHQPGGGAAGGAGPARRCHHKHERRRSRGSSSSSSSSIVRGRQRRGGGLSGDGVGDPVQVPKRVGHLPAV